MLIAVSELIDFFISPQIKVESEKHVLFDHEFTKLFKKLEGSLVYSQM